MKRDQDDAEDCDPFSLEPFNDMDDSLIIRVESHRFHLPSLYAWVVNRGSKANPFTNLPFDDKQVEFIRSEAVKRFPLVVSILQITGQKVDIQTTSLSNPLSLISMLMPGRNTLFEFICDLSESSQSFRVLERKETLVKWMDTHGQVAFTDMGVKTKLILMRSLISTPPQSLVQNTLYREIANRHGWPSERFTERINAAEHDIQYNELLRVRYDAIRSRRQRQDAENPEPPQPPNTHRFYVQLNTSLGWAYGPVLVYPTADAEKRVFGDLEALVRDKLHNVIEVPEFPARYIFAGKVYHKETRFADLSNILKDECVIHMTF